MSESFRILLASGIGAIAAASFARDFQTSRSPWKSLFPRRSLTNSPAQISANDSVSHCSSASGIFTTWPQYWWAISCEKRSFTPPEKSWLTLSPIGLNASEVMNMKPGGACPNPKEWISTMLNSSNGNLPRNGS